MNQLEKKIVLYVQVYTTWLKYIYTVWNWFCTTNLIPSYWLLTVVLWLIQTLLFFQ